MGKARIDNQTVQDPQMLADVLNHMDTEIDALRTFINDLKTKYEDHRHSVAGAAATGTKPSTEGATAGATASTLLSAVVEQVERGR